MATLDERLEAFALSFKDDPDFYRIPFPEHILKRIGMYKEKDDISAMKAVNYAMMAPSLHRYTAPIQIIDQSETVKTFPNLVELARSTSTSDSKTQELADSSSPPASDAVVGSVVSSACLSSSYSQDTQPLRTELFSPDHQPLDERHTSFPLNEIS